MATTANPSLASLLSRTSLEDHSQLLKASEVALKVSKTDSQAQHVKVVALLNLNQFNDAVSFIEKSGKDLKEKAALEYAYALYKAGRLQDAASVAATLQRSRGAQHVEAQVRYRLEDYSETFRIYQEIQKQRVPDEDFDIRVNQSAIDAQGQWLGLTTAFRKPGREDLEAFETAYNAACGSIARGELAQAEMLLKRAKELCKYSEDLTESQKEAELLPIIVQQLYVLHRQGKPSEAQAIANEIKVESIEDLPTKQVASNNLLLGSSEGSNPFLAHKIFHGAPQIPEGDKLFSYQSIPLTSNEKTIDLQSFKFNGIVDSTRKRLAKISSPTTNPEALILSAFNAAAHARSEVGKAAIKNVLPELERRPDDIGLIMTLVQMYTLTGNTTSAIELVEALLKRLDSSAAENEQGVRYHPGLVSIVISLYRMQGRKAQIKQELAKAASYWRHRSKPPVSLLRSAGVSLLQSTAREDLQAASEIFKKLYDEQPSDTATVAGYVASNALSDPKSVQSLADKLAPVNKLIADVDTDALENAGIPQSTNALAIASSAGRSSRKRAADASASNQKKRVRKSRLPKDYDPSSNTKPDPERWLPMRDRSYYRAPKSKKKGRKGDDRTQGGNVNEDLDVSKQTQQSTKGGEVVGGSGGGGGKKKKGKGKK